MRRISVCAALAAAAVFSTFACSDGSPSGPSGSGSGAATLNLRITDSPYSKAQAVLVTFSEVAMHKDGNWTKVPFANGGSTRTCDLKKLQNNAQDLLGTGGLEAGAYTMIRLIVQSSTVYHDNSASSPTPCAPSIAAPAGASSPVTIPSGEVRLNGTFALTNGGATNVLVDFDGEQSISQTGSGTYMMSPPVIRLVSVQ